MKRTKDSRNKRGFTLIEMLVVIAVVGILSATVLTALGPARSKARDSRIISGLHQVAAMAETVYDGDYDFVPYIFDTTTDPPANNWDKAAVDIKDTGGTLAVSRITTGNSLTFSAHSVLASNSNSYYCVDSAGARKSYTNVTSVPDWTTNVCPPSP